MMSDPSETRDGPASTARDAVGPSRRDAVEDWLAVFVRMSGLPASEAAGVRDELEDHLRSRVDDLLITGVSEPEAVRRAVGELGETAALARGFRNARRTPRRRLSMYALFAIAGSALVLSTAALYSGGGTSTEPPPTEPAVVAIEGEAPKIAPFNENLRRYEISAMVPDMQRLAYFSGGIPAFASNEPALNKSVAEITDTIQRLVDAERWEANGGDEAKIHSIGTTLFIDAPPEMHEGVIWVLQSLQQNLQKAQSEARERALDAQRELQVREKERLASEESARAQAEEKLAAQIVALEQEYKSRTEQLVKQAEEKALLEFKEIALKNAFTNTPVGDEEAQIAEIRGELTRLDIETETVLSLLLRTRELLINRQLQRYGPGPATTSAGLESTPGSVPDAQRNSNRIPDAARFGGRTSGSGR